MPRSSGLNHWSSCSVWGDTRHRHRDLSLHVCSNCRRCIWVRELDAPPQDTGNRWRGCFLTFSRSPGVMFQLPQILWWAVRNGTSTLPQIFSLMFPFSSSLHLYLHLVCKWDQLIKLPFHTVCYGSQTLVLQKAWEGASKWWNFQNRFKLCRLEANS